jgi:hypothetical protein
VVCVDVDVKLVVSAVVEVVVQVVVCVSVVITGVSTTSSVQAFTSTSGQFKSLLSHARAQNNLLFLPMEQLEPGDTYTDPPTDSRH